MRFPEITAQQWRAQVDKELAGAPFEKVLVHRTPEGLAVQPLYTERPTAEAVELDALAPPFRLCVRIEGDTRGEVIASELEGGADALWLDRDSARTAVGLVDPARVDLARTFVVVECGAAAPAAVLEELSGAAPAGVPFALDVDPFGALARGRIPSSGSTGLAEARAALGRAVQFAEGRWPDASFATASTLPYHDAGADAADEIAIALSTGAAYLEDLMSTGLSAAAAARHVLLRVAIGRDTFGEMCKLRALRIVWGKVLVASGAAEAPRARIHAVCSSRTMAQRDPWVNMLRVTTQVFAAILGDADLVTPAPFDGALRPASALGRRVARNTALVLREESSLGKVKDPAGGSYYFDSLTDALAREGWKRFQAIEKEGGIERALVSGHLRTRLEASWRGWVDQLVKRKASVLGVSEFANLDEKLPRPAGRAEAPSPSDSALPVHRDAEPFEDLRLRAEALATPPGAILVALGPLAESRARVGFASNFFGAGGIRVGETTRDEAAAIACLCGSDERYAAEAVERARALKAAGCRRVLLAGRPGALEASLREAGVDGFLYAGCDAVALLSELLAVR
jgi:methylmalonyl-CoA mutase